MEKRGAVIGIDIGGTSVKSILMSSGRIERRRKIVSPRRYEELLDGLSELIDEFDPTGKASIGVALPGSVDFARGVARSSPNFPDWRDVAIRDDLERLTSRPVTIENDANAAALAELSARGGRRDSFVRIAIGAGIGAGIVLGGVLWRGRSGNAGEIGHFNIEPDGRACGCSSRGCLERYASALALAALAAEALGGSEPVDARRLKEMADEGDPRALEIFARAGSALGEAIATLYLALDIGGYIIGGGVAPALDHMRASILDRVTARAFTFDESSFSLTASTLGDDAAALGAAALALDRADSR